MNPRKKKNRGWALLPFLVALPLFGGLILFYQRYEVLASELINAVMKLGVQP